MYSTAPSFLPPKTFFLFFEKRKHDHIAIGVKHNLPIAEKSPFEY